MAELLSYQRPAHGLSVSEYRMRKLEAIADAAWTRITSQQLSGFVNHVERYYTGVMHGEDLIEIP